MAEDWHTLASIEAVEEVGYDPYHETKEAYIQSIFYQLEMINNLILTGPNDAIYIIVGDHQPPLRAFSDYDGAATPLHIVSQDPDLSEALAQFNFSPGLLLGDGIIKHEGFYSLFMKIILSTYGDYELAEIPKIQPDGLDLNELILNGSGR